MINCWGLLVLLVHMVIKCTLINMEDFHLQVWWYNHPLNFSSTFRNLATLYCYVTVHGCRTLYGTRNTLNRRYFWAISCFVNNVVPTIVSKQVYKCKSLRFKGKIIKLLTHWHTTFYNTWLTYIYIYIYIYVTLVA